MVHIKVEEFEGRSIHLAMVTENVEETWKIFDEMRAVRQKRSKKLEPRFIVHVLTADVLLVDTERAWEGHLSGRYHHNYAKYIYASKTSQGEWQVLVLRPNGETDWVPAIIAMKEDPIGLRDFAFQEKLYKFSPFWYWIKVKPVKRTGGRPLQAAQSQVESQSSEEVFWPCQEWEKQNLVS